MRGLLLWSCLAMALDIGVARITYGTILPALLRDLHLDYVAGGLLATANLAAYLAGTIVAPRLGRRFGMPMLACCGHVLFGAGAVLCGIAGGAVTLAIGRALMGFGSGVGLLALFVVIFLATAPEKRAAASAFVWSGIGMAIVASGLAAPWLLTDGGTWRLSFLIPAVAAVATGLAVLRPPPPLPVPPGPAEAETRPGDHAARSLPLAAAYLLFGVGYIAFSTFLGTQLAGTSASSARVATTWLVLGISSLAGSALLGFVLRKPALRRQALVLALGSAAVGAGLIGLIGPAGTLGGSVLIGLGFATTPAIVTARVRERTSDAAYPRIFGLATIGLGIGQLLGPLAAGAIAQRSSPDAVMVFSAAAYLAGVALAAVDSRSTVARREA